MRSVDRLRCLQRGLAASATLAAALTFLLPSPSASPTPTLSGSGSGTSSDSSVGELSIDTGQASHLGNTASYRYVILQEYMYAHVAAIKSANPKTKVFAYLETAVTHVRTCSGSNPPAYSPHDSFGVNYCYAVKYHPGWFLKNSAGQRLTYQDYLRYAVMDIGNSSYQMTWAANAVAAAKADGFDGIYMDDVNTHPGHGIDSKISKYDDQSYGQAMIRLVSAVGGQLRSHGLLAYANLSADPWVAWQRSDALAMAAHLTAVNREHYSRWGDICGPFSERFNTTAIYGTPPVDVELSYDRAIQATGAFFTGIDYGYSPTTSQDVATMAYGRAFFLLAWDGRPGSAYIFRPCGTVDPANSAWTVNLGTPSGAAKHLSNGLYKRVFSRGLVLLNPSRYRSLTTSLPSGYVRSGSITLKPKTALLLRAA
ncbi:MAG: hypothetical protein QOC66_4075 [Pseudonocardiales bacterium]|nr:hypothetical protein [Pseudonocardiales bacterium]